MGEENILNRLKDCQEISIL